MQQHSQENKIKPTPAIHTNKTTSSCKQIKAWIKKCEVNFWSTTPEYEILLEKSDFHSPTKY